MLLLLLGRQLGRSVLASLQTEPLTIQLTVLLLQGLELCQLQWAQLLASAEHLRWRHDNLPLRQLDKLGLARILEGAERAHRLVHGCTSAVAGLESATLLSEGLLLVLSLILIVRLTPITVEISR